MTGGRLADKNSAAVAMSMLPCSRISNSDFAAAVLYDSWFDSPWGRYAAEIEFTLIAKALQPVPRKRILDAGCGTGRFAQRLVGLGAEVFGVDLDPSMLDLAQQRLKYVALADARHLPFESGQFDATLAVTLCEFSDDPTGTLAELARVTRPGGNVVIGLLNQKSPWGWRRRKRPSRPPWSEATFVKVEELASTASRIGTASKISGLFSPGVALPAVISRMIEACGRRLLPRAGAFQVITLVTR